VWLQRLAYFYRKENKFIIPRYDYYSYLGLHKQNGVLEALKIMSYTVLLYLLIVFNNVEIQVREDVLSDIMDH
jgi:hypothetical protein